MALESPVVDFMKKPNGQSLIYWFLGAMLAANLLLAGFAWNSIAQRIDRIEDKVEQIQQAYGQIGETQAEVDNIESRLDRIERLLDSLITTDGRYGW